MLAGRCTAPEEEPVGHYVSRNVTPFRRTLALVVAAMDLPFWLYLNYFPRIN